MTSETTSTRMYVNGNYANAYTEVPTRDPGRAWRDGMVSGNGENGYVTSGSPYADSFIFQHMWFNFPSPHPRTVPEELTAQLGEARLNVFNLNDQWKIKDSRGETRARTFYYSYHPGHQLRLEMLNKGTVSAYERWTNYETAETGVRYADERGEWVRTSFTSRTDNVSITRIARSSTGARIDMTISIDDISGMYKARDGDTEVSALRYKKLVGPRADYIAQVAHYPAYPGSELANGGYAGLTRVVAVNGKQTLVLLPDTNESMNVGAERNPAIRIENADAVYLITKSDRTFDMGAIEAFADTSSYDLVDRLLQHADAVLRKYADAEGRFDYDAALAPHAAWQSAEWGAVRFELRGDEKDKQADNVALIEAQKQSPHKINHAFMEQVYNQGRYALICCGGTSAPRLYGMWTGEWNPGWRGIYTLDANVNLQVAAMNTGHLTASQLGYIDFFLRNTPDFALNAEMAYGMHDALQVSVNSDGDRGMHVEYDNDYPFQYWNAGASWCLLPIYEYWQCYGNRQIPIRDTMRIRELRPFLDPADGGLSEAAFERLLAKGELDLERDILLPLLTKQANFWDQICTPTYYTDAEGRARHEPGKTALLPGERYMIIPGYSPENHPIGYTSTITANATMDIAAARDGLRMAIELEKAVGREGYGAAVAKWEALLEVLPDYLCDTDGALREWAMYEYTENNNHRHLSHLYPAWPAYETQADRKLFDAARIAVENRDKYNTGDATAGHGWMHKALVYARLKNGDGLLASLLPMMNDDGYYASLMSDHDTNRRNDTYCTDTLFGNLAAVHEALVFSNTGEIEVLPALPSDWTSGSIRGLMARTRVEVKALTWDLEAGVAKVLLRSGENHNRIAVKARIPWRSATLNGAAADIRQGENGKYIPVLLHAGADAEICFSLRGADDKSD